MYESPIQVITNKIGSQYDDYVYTAILNVGVTVDKDELVRALQYDRDQYKKGYEDGYNQCELDCQRKLNNESEEGKCF